MNSKFLKPQEKRESKMNSLLKSKLSFLLFFFLMTSTLAQAQNEPIPIDCDCALGQNVILDQGELVYWGHLEIETIKGQTRIKFIKEGESHCKIIQACLEPAEPGYCASVKGTEIPAFVPAHTYGITAIRTLDCKPAIPPGKRVQAHNYSLSP